MEHTRQCISCGSGALVAYAADPAPFLAERIPALQEVSTWLMRCRHCDLTFYNPRLGSKDLTALYQGYRDETYQAMRERHEPWYTPEVNQSIGKGDQEVRARTSHMRAMLAEHLDFQTVRAVLDYGGDRGQYILDDFAAVRRVVFEISGVDPLPGVEGVSDPSILRPGDFDLILCNHVLEHLSYPADLVRQLAALAGPCTRYYFEVPLETPFRGSLKHALRRAGLRFLPGLVHPWLRRSGKVPFQMHEHVNQFSLQSFGKLLEGQGFEVLGLEAVPVDTGWARTHVLVCVARVR